MTFIHNNDTVLLLGKAPKEQIIHLMLGGKAIEHLLLIIHSELILEHYKRHLA